MRPLPLLFKRRLLVALLASWTVAGPLVGAYAAGAAPVAAVADADLAKARTADPELVDGLAELRRDIDKLLPRELGPAEKPPRAPAETILGFNRRFQELVDGAQLLAARKPELLAQNSALVTAFVSVGQRINLLSLEAIPLDLKDVSSALTEIESRAGTLEAGVRARAADLTPPAREEFSRRLNALNEDGTRVWNHLHTASLIIDDMGDGVSGTSPSKPGKDFIYELSPGGKLNESANPLQTRVANLSARLLAIDHILHGERTAGEATRSKALQARMTKLLGNPFSVPSGEDKTGGASDAGGATGASVTRPARPDGAVPLPPAARTRTLLDLRPVPAPKPADEEPRPLPAVFTGGRGRDASPAETKKINALRAAGKTRTIGAPEERAKFVYKQEGETCGIAAQVQVLADAGLVPADAKSLRAKEDELYARALSLGYYEGSPADPDRRKHGGNPVQFIGNLLYRPMRKSFAASEKELFEAASSGRIVMASFSSEHLWNDRRFRGQGHVVAITGVEVDRKSGQPLGYYINDTGTNEGGRFVAAEQFLKAWRNRGRTIFEPL
jgi:hypothetical protein